MKSAYATLKYYYLISLGGRPPIKWVKRVEEYVMERIMIGSGGHD